MHPDDFESMIKPAPAEQSGKRKNPLALMTAASDPFMREPLSLPHGARILESQIYFGIDGENTSVDTGLTHIGNLIRPYSFAHMAHYTNVRWFSPRETDHSMRFIGGNERKQPVYVTLASKDGIFLWQHDEPFAVLRQQPVNPAKAQDYRQSGFFAHAALFHRRLNHKSLELDVGFSNYGPQLRTWSADFISFHNTLIDHPNGAKEANLYFFPIAGMPGHYCKCKPSLLNELENNTKFAGFIPTSRQKLIAMYAAIEACVVATDPVRTSPLFEPTELL